MNLPKISWYSSESSISTCERHFVDILNDRFLLQLNHLPTRGSNVLDLVISSMPDQVNAFEVINPDKASVFTDHCIVSFKATIAVKAPSKNQRFVYNYVRGDFEGLWALLHATNLANFVSNDDVNINIDWHNWKDALLAAVKDHIPKRKLKGRNPVPWINGPAP